MSTGRMSDDQFEKLLATIRVLGLQQNSEQQVQERKTSKSSFANCNVRFHGQRDNDAVEEFINAIETYKDMENISDKNALKGLPLLFQGIASTWWKGVRRDAKSWADALTLLRDHFSPTKPPYQIYVEIFESKQSHTPIDTFVCQKRALIAKLPEGRHDIETELDFIYGLLDSKYQQQIPRHEIKTYRELLEKGRNVERHSK
ncbi:activity-regulated cytoskeleton associated protein 2 [Eurosta solidaginis]|uniref:activity-regulated cytoskeleton associated protein 2 n=1 Tax=Eurosta solidaginis TaxID=178769 RepID=UPI0035314598